ncbi:hypothetical protein NMY3_03140 [Candidatus Nitrosocosmicus oleophilus]|uniref:Uncharacterized protein n=1 Tax=Candidatus Nitrosocosmicus oleophilus TaxID=1353260 RepID=A0A654M3V8_9ARCH|nr:hypothetical protein NMY3_03140 [Candidatus Nitrosocosmicus oleophilus]
MITRISNYTDKVISCRFVFCLRNVLPEEKKALNKMINANGS